MGKVYCQNDLCKYYAKSRIYKNYGRCKKQEVFMTWQFCQETHMAFSPRIFPKFKRPKFFKNLIYCNNKAYQI